MKKTALVIVSLALAACSKPAPTTENAANAMEANLTAQAAAMDKEAEIATNAAAAAAMNSAAATYNSSVAADGVKNSN